MNHLFFYSIIVQEADLDSFGHLNNAAYLRLYEQARWDLITKNGFGLEKIIETGLGPTLLEVKMQFLKELKPRDKIIIESQCISYERKVGVIRQIMKRGDEVCNTADFTIGLFDTSLRKLVIPTNDWLKAVGIPS